MFVVCGGGGGRGYGRGGLEDAGFQETIIGVTSPGFSPTPLDVTFGSRFVHSSYSQIHLHFSYLLVVVHTIRYRLKE